MSVKYTVVKRQNPIDRNQEKYYPQAKLSGEVTLETLSRRISRATSASRGDVLLVITSLVDEIIESLEEGNAVRIGDLGSMRVSLKTTGEESAGNVTSSNIRNAKIIFTPSVMLKDRVKRINFRQTEPTQSESGTGGGQTDPDGPGDI